MLELRDVTKSYGRRTALGGVSLELGTGVYGLLGPNGAGKSTLMNLLTVNLRQDSGSILWDGRDIRSLGASYRALLGYAPQGQCVYDSLTGRRFLSFMAALKGIRGREVSVEVDRVLTAVGLDRDGDRTVGGYSGGMKRRLVTAQAILGEPRIVVLDEPSAGLDPKERVRLRELISSLAQDRTVLVSTHVVSDVEPIADSLILLRSGQVADTGSPGELLERYGADSVEDVYMSVFGEAGGDD